MSKKNFVKNFEDSAMHHWQTRVSQRGSPFGDGFSLSEIVKQMNGGEDK